MSEIQFYELKCKRCGGQLEQNGAIYKCESCGKTFEKQVVSDVADQLRAVLNEQKQEAVANLRQELWKEMHEQYINSDKITDIARDIKKYLPDDYFANFCEVANSGNDRQVSRFLSNTPQSAMADYADVVLDFMLKSVTASNLNAISLFIERAFKGDTQNYDKYITRYEQEAQKVNSGIYELILTRDVFLAYSSADIDKVLELCDYLERNKITCFLALRNLRHGRGAVDNYDRALQMAIDNCKTVVFVSSNNSRSFECDALTKELPYIRQKDIDGAPAEFKRAYDKMPAEYFITPRVEYLIEDYSGNVAEGVVKEFFHGLEWCKSKEVVAARIAKYLTETHETTAQKAERENRELQQRIEEERRKAEEVKARSKELELKIAEAEKARVEAESKSATNINNYSQSSGGVSMAQINAWLVRAEQESEQGKSSSAKTYYEKVKDAAPDNSKAWLGLFYIVNNTTKSAGIKVWDDCNDLVEATSRIKENNTTLSTFESYEFKNALRYAKGTEAEELKKFQEDYCRKLKNGNLSILAKLYRLADSENNFTIAKQQYEFIIQKLPENAEAWLGLFYILNNTTKRAGIKVYGGCGNLGDAQASFAANKKTLETFNSAEFNNALKYSNSPLKEEIKNLKETVCNKIDECNKKIADRMYAAAESHRASNNPIAVDEYNLVLQIDKKYTDAYKGLLLFDVGAADLNSLKARLNEQTLYKLKESAAYADIHKYAEGKLKKEVEELDEAISKKIDLLIDARNREETIAKTELETRKKEKDRIDANYKAKISGYSLKKRVDIDTSRTIVKAMIAFMVMLFSGILCGACIIFTISEGVESAFEVTSDYVLAVICFGVFFVALIFFVVQIIQLFRAKSYKNNRREYEQLNLKCDNEIKKINEELKTLKNNVNQAIAKSDKLKDCKTYFSQVHF